MDKNLGQREKIILNLTKQQKTKIWIKTLLYSYKYFPNLIKTVDKIIEMRASTISFSSDIFNSKRNENQFEHIIDLGERKKNLLNIYVMITNFFDFLSVELKDIAHKKFIEKWTNEKLSDSLNVSIRTIYRKTTKVIDEIYSGMKKNNWSLELIELQVKDEQWLFERYKHYENEFIYSSDNSKKEI